MPNNVRPISFLFKMYFFKVLFKVLSNNFLYRIEISKSLPKKV